MEAPTALWRYVPLSEFKAPSAPSAQALRSLHILWQSAKDALRWRRQKDDQSAGFERLTEDSLAGVVPKVDVAAAASALLAALGDWPEDPNGGIPRVVVGPPGSAVHEVVAAAAENRRWECLTAPGRAELLESFEGADQRLASARLEPLVLCGLERWYLRSARAMPAARQLCRSLSRAAGPRLVSCDSWAWSFLDRAVGAKALLGEPLVLAPLEAQHLAGWLGPPMAAAGWTCRALGDDNELLFDQGPGAADKAEPRLNKLAAIARGNPGVALAIWRSTLRRKTDGDVNTVFVAPPHDAELAVPPGLDKVSTHLLHTILLHGGLDRPSLAAVLPQPASELERGIRNLGRNGLLVESRGELALPLAGLSAARRFLESQGHWVDGC